MYIYIYEIEIESSYYNMNLNYEKCVNLTTNRKTSSIKFRDGSLVPRQRHAKYLGTILTDTASNMAEFQNRLAKAIKTCAQLKLFGTKHTPVLHGFLRVFNSVVISKLMYGLETIQLAQNELNKLDSFHSLIECKRINL
jgi:hypothetical protein